MSLDDLAFPPVASEMLQVTASMIRASNLDAKPEAHDRNLLALDLGTHTGWAVRRRDGTIIHGTESFSPRKSWGPGQRWKRYRSWLAQIIDREQVHAITYELVHRHLGTEAAHAYGAFQALTEMSAEGRNIELLPVGVGVIKRHWTGKGNADKAAMIAEAKRRGFRPDSDNAADALAILHWAIEQESE
ncbi:hypothetical protein [Castellaniella sp. S9]|uniref:hypothetical protein n=1 Tax=Castellaniella sp. S9 TaxID=2993652 RepID=UPI0022B56015|nr:hypothetical protein [Castellaniella sp. S9]